MPTKIGDRVRIKNSDQYQDGLTGLLGTVERIYKGNRVGVNIDGCQNDGSKYGVFWLYEIQLEIIESEEKSMLLPNYTPVAVQFLDRQNHDGRYIYACYDPEIAEYDMVVVRTGHHGFALAQVFEVAPANAEPVKYDREIVARVNCDAYYARQEKAGKLAKLKATMDEKVQALQQVAVYEQLSEKDPELKSMLEEFKALNG